jgi:hypothetical protein
MPIQNLGQIVGLAAVLIDINATAQYDYFDHNQRKSQTTIQATVTNGSSDIILF